MPDAPGHIAAQSELRLMLRVSLTGGTACGKSTVAKMFSDLGAVVIDADKIVHELYRKGEPVYGELVERFGPGILASDGEIDRRRLATLAFEVGRVQELNAIVHPPVGLREKEWVDRVMGLHPGHIAMVESPRTLGPGATARLSRVMADRG